MTDATIRARTALALGRQREAGRAIQQLCADRDGWGAAVGGALRACLAALRGESAAAKHGLARAVTELERWELGLYAAAARYRYGRLTRDAALERAAVDELTSRGVRAPERMFSSLLPVP